MRAEQLRSARRLFGQFERVALHLTKGEAARALCAVQLARINKTLVRITNQIQAEMLEAEHGNARKGSEAA